MKIYSYKYTVKTEIEKAFNYFLQKEYLVKYFSQTEKEDIEIISQNSNKKIYEGEEIKLLIKEKEYNISIKLIVEEIRSNEFINYHLYLDEIKELQVEGNDLEGEDFDSFMNKFIAQKIDYKIDFKLQKDFLIINEQSEIFVNSIWLKMFWKCLGIYFRFKQRKTHIQVKKELEEK